MLAFHLHQMVSEPTRVSPSMSSLIDHVYTSDPSLVKLCSTLPPLGNSDHLCISTMFCRSTPALQRFRRKMWSYKSADWAQAHELLTSNLPADISLESDVDTVWTSWKTQFLAAMSTCIPSRIKKSLPWLNADIIRLIGKRDHLRRLAKSTSSEAICRKYRRFRNLAVSTIRKAKNSFLQSMSSLIRSPKDFWSMYHSLSPNRERIPHTLKEIAEQSFNSLQTGKRI